MHNPEPGGHGQQGGGCRDAEHGHKERDHPALIELAREPVHIEVFPEGAPVVQGPPEHLKAVMEPPATEEANYGRRNGGGDESEGQEG